MTRSPRTPRRLPAALLVAALAAALPPAAPAGEIPRNRRIGLVGLDWDLRKGAEQAPPFLRVSPRPRSAAGKGYRVVKWNHPVGAAERRALEAAGLDVVGYLPDDAFLVRGRGGARVPSRPPAGAAWIGELPPVARIAPELRGRAVAPGSGAPVELRVVLHEGEPSAAIRDLLASAAGRPPTSAAAIPGRGEWLRAAVAPATLADLLAALAARPEVATVEPFREKKLHNASGDWVHQSGVSGSTPLFESHRLFGCGQVVAISDTGFDWDSCFFQDAAVAPPIGTCEDEIPCVAVEENPLARKTIAYYDWGNDGQPGSSPGCDHGNHVQGSVAGNSLLGGAQVNCASRSYTNPLNADGMAPGAQVVSQELGDGLEFLNSRNGSIHNLATVAWENGARIHTSSWGSGCCGSVGCLEGCQILYDTDARDADLAAWQKRDLLILFSAGNDHGCCDAPRELGSPGVAKNVLTVGALGHDFSADYLASYSSQGPTLDGRLKPDVSGQGSGVISSRADGVGSPMNCQTCTLSGTSMATPTIAGIAALVREYLVRGFYPTGTETAEHAVTDPSSALLKALLVDSGRGVLNVTGHSPNNGAGYGRVLLEDTLAFAGDARRLWFADESAGLDRGESWETALAVSEGEPLEISLAWTDAPALPGANPTLVNDLALEVTAPDGVAWFVALDPSTGLPEGTTDATRAGDALNNVEQLAFDAPAAGTWRIRVRGVSVPYGPQPFAVVVTGRVTPCSPPPAANGVAATPAGPNRIQVLWGPAAGASSYRVLRAPGGCPSAGPWTTLATTAGTLFHDGSASGNVTYCYAVEALDATGGCASPRSAGSSATATGDCLAAPTFAGAASATPLADGRCGVTLSWAPAVAACPGFDVRYNVHRSTLPDFLPDASNRIVSCVSGTSFVDLDVASGTTYHYVVRAEDGGASQGGPCGGGREDSGLVRVRATPSNPLAPAVGDFVDDGGDTVAPLLADPAWRITRSRARTGTFAWHNAADGELYAPGLCASLVTPPMELVAGLSHEITFAIAYDAEYQWDGLAVEIRPADGSAFWDGLRPVGGYPATLAQTQGNGCAFGRTKEVFSGPPENGTLSPWFDVTVPIPASWSGKSVEIRFVFTSDGGLEYEGFFLDDIRVTNVRLPGPCAPVAAVPAPAFVASPWPACPGEPVTFVESTAGDVTTRAWDFGDGGASAAASPTHSFVGPGNRTVTLRAAGPAGERVASATYAVACDGAGRSPVLAVPGVARATGAAGSFFKTTLWILRVDAGAEPAEVALTYAAAPGSFPGNGTRPTLSMVSGQTVTLDDPLGTLFEVTGSSSGVLTIHAPSGVRLVATARTFNAAAPEGTYGQFIEAIRLDDPEGLPTAPQLLEGLSGDGVMRTNVGVVNLGESEIVASIETRTAEGGVAGTPVTVTVAPRAVVPVNAMNRAAGAGEHPLFTVRVAADGPFAAWASRLDNATSDPVFLDGERPGRRLQWVDGVASATGAFGTFFRTSLVLANRGASAAPVTVAFFPRGSAGELARATVTLAAGQSREWRDVLRDLAGLDRDAAGVLRIESSAADVAAWGRTYNDSPNGTYGQFVPAIGTENLLPSSGSWLVGLSDDPSFRTNLGLFNAGDAPVTATLELRSASGNLLGRGTETIPAGTTLFFNGKVRALAGGVDVAGASLAVVPSAPGSLFAWGSVVDNRSGDAIFVRPVR